MSELQSVARLRIHDGELDEFKRLSAECFETCSGSGELCGEPSDALRRRLQGSPVQVCTPFLAR